MKHIYTKLCLAIFMAAFIALSGCNGKTLKKKFNIVAEVNFDIDATGTTAYNNAQVLDAAAQASASDYAKYRKDAISVTLDSARYYTYYVNPNDTAIQINLANFTIAKPDGSDELTLGEVQNVNLMGAFEEDKALKINLNSAAISSFSNRLMNNPYTARIGMQGDVNQPSEFGMRVKFYFTFEAYIL